MAFTVPIWEVEPYFFNWNFMRWTLGWDGSLNLFLLNRAPFLRSSWLKLKNEIFWAKFETPTCGSSVFVAGRKQKWTPNDLEIYIITLIYQFTMYRVSQKKRPLAEFVKCDHFLPVCLMFLRSYGSNWQMPSQIWLLLSKISSFSVFLW